MLRDMKERGERGVSADTLKRGPRSSDVLPREQPKLSDFGVTKTQSSCWQRLADMPEEEFEAKVERVDTVTRGRP